MTEPTNRERAVAVLSSMVNDRDERLRRIRDWCDAYPVEVFPEPDLAAAKASLGDDLYSAVHAAWARRLLKAIRALTEPAEPK
jgi:hypothetical protein